ncbi:putative membrane protein, required for colicin V production [Aequorivita sublithincola DSM 14238]|uniref:Putative membrane protein, required for colicin V production n=1 Tax=Aequorivita sublithincola (strain DSM 14238 / LMG 21431 / ACAM 643 / 9-3) TaxID=746697 RepID=I3YUE6_AEQSU|nr:CvpA family protein [Aequorivita sublithincola]AFL80614.1 putative membrane protein, required for colicin V production [Aequorivita sublithincola DSM 14238]
MNTIDIVLGIIFIIAFFVGFKKGLLRALASLVGLVVAVYCAMYFSGYVSVYLEKWFNWSQDLNTISSFLITFLLIMLLFSLVGRLLTKVADFAMLGIFNKLFGGVFNVFKFAFLISVIFMFVNASENYSILTEEKRETSVLYGPVASLAPAILPAIMKEVDDLNIDLPEINNSTENTEEDLE